MRRVWLMAGLVFLAGCDSSLFQAHADVAATAEGQKLPSERLAAIMSNTKGMRFTPEAAELVANIWVDFTLFSQAIAAGELPEDSTAIANAMWAQIAEIRGSRWFDSLVALHSDFGPESADSLYDADTLRVFQHILFRVEPNSEPPVRAEARRNADEALAQVRSGDDFGALATRLSADPASARDSGYLPPSPQGAFVTAFDSAGWRLSEGEVSGIVETPFGYHIIKRPGKSEVQGRLIEFQLGSLVGRLDSLHRDSLSTATGLEVSGDAPALVRSSIDDPDGAAESSRDLASWEGGEFTQSDLLRWISALPPQSLSQIQSAPDEQLANFTRLLAENELLLQEAEDAGIGLTPLEWQTMEQGYRAEIDTLKQMLGLGYDVSDSTLAPDERAKVAALKLDQYFDGVMKGTSQVRKMPASLSLMLRAEGDWDISRAGLAHALDLAQPAASPDSAGPAAPGPGMRPAPGQPPIGPGTDSTPAPVTSSAGGE